MKPLHIQIKELSDKGDELSEKIGQLTAKVETLERILATSITIENN